MKLIIISLMIFMLTFTAVEVKAAQKIGRKEALSIGRTVPEVEALYALNGGEFAECIERRVEKPCQSNWVTCIDDAWVVSFTVGNRCGVANDGRLSVTLLIDSREGEVVSKFPEIEYFESTTFCRDDFDCMAVRGTEHQCLNFIAAQAGRQELNENTQCGCRESQCVVNESK